MQMPFNGVVYCYFRGMTNYPLIVGDVQLPPTARLKLHQNINVTVGVQEFLPLVPRRANSSGMLFQVTLSGESKFIGFMEGCVRVSRGAPFLVEESSRVYFSAVLNFNFYVLLKQKNVAVERTRGCGGIGRRGVCTWLTQLI